MRKLRRSLWADVETLYVMTSEDGVHGGTATDREVAEAYAARFGCALYREDRVKGSIVRSLKIADYRQRKGQRP